jgi:hypothetical protein
MDLLREFLEASTIHGVAHVSRAKVGRLAPGLNRRVRGSAKLTVRLWALWLEQRLVGSVADTVN